MIHRLSTIEQVFGNQKKGSADASRASAFQKWEPTLQTSLKKINKKFAAWSNALDYGIEVPKDSLITIEDVGADAINHLAAKGYTNLVVAPVSVYSLDCSPSVPWRLNGYESANPDYAYNIPGVTTPSAVKGDFTMLWTETIKRHNLDRYVFPRASAAAERFSSYSAAPVYVSIKTAARLDRFRASLVNELAIAAADITYLETRKKWSTCRNIVTTQVPARKSLKLDCQQH
ncbi:UNVERIFIED_CONTAM: hypothetical protein HDU68_009895 [Siphonaria sp. JEL0065]|nr:hypothetical protein HDU68_009895 [Siphonaria sp. JEL0065]